MQFHSSQTATLATTSLRATNLLLATTLLAVVALANLALAESPSPVAVSNADAETQQEMKPYRESIANTEVSFEMIPIPGGTFQMGSPEGEEGRGDDEGPRHKVKVDPFWMGKCEVTWNEYEVFMFNLDIQRRELRKVAATDREKLADAITRPTKPYTDMTFDMGKNGYPAICMTQHAAKVYCQWLSAKTGRYYRLPTEAEWEYACRAGTETAYSFGDDADELEDYAWYVDNAENELGDPGYQKVGQKKPNPWGLCDMHGNVSEWVLDAHSTDFYGKNASAVAVNPLCVPTQLYPRVVRGGSWDDDPEMLRSAARRFSEEDWKEQDPQLPQSIWFHTDALTVGFRVLRPLREPTDEEKKKFGSDQYQSTPQ